MKKKIWKEKTKRTRIKNAVDNDWHYIDVFRIKVERVPEVRSAREEAVSIELTVTSDSLCYYGLFH